MRKPKDRMYSTAAAAREIGVSVSLLKYLKGKGRATAEPVGPDYGDELMWSESEVKRLREIYLRKRELKAQLIR